MIGKTMKVLLVGLLVCALHLSAMGSPTYVNSRTANFTWDVCWWAFGYDMWQQTTEGDTLVGYSYDNYHTVLLPEYIKVRYRVVPIDMYGQAWQIRSSEYSDWFFYGLRISMEWPHFRLTWPGDAGIVTVYRSLTLDPPVWEIMAQTSDSSYLDPWPMYQSHRMFYRIEKE